MRNSQDVYKRQDHGQADVLQQNLFGKGQGLAVYDHLPQVDPIDVADRPGVQELQNPQGSVEFRHLTFRYPDGEYDVLQDISFTIQMCIRDRHQPHVFHPAGSHRPRFVWHGLAAGPG